MPLNLPEEHMNFKISNIHGNSVYTKIEVVKKKLMIVMTNVKVFKKKLNKGTTKIEVVKKKKLR